MTEIITYPTETRVANLETECRRLRAYAASLDQQLAAERTARAGLAQALAALVERVSALEAAASNSD